MTHFWAIWFFHIYFRLYGKQRKKHYGGYRTDQLKCSNDRERYHAPFRSTLFWSKPCHKALSKTHDAYPFSAAIDTSINVCKLAKRWFTLILFSFVISICFFIPNNNLSWWKIFVIIFICLTNITYLVHLQNNVDYKWVYPTYCKFLVLYLPWHYHIFKYVLKVIYIVPHVLFTRFSQTHYKKKESLLLKLSWL